MKIINEPLPGAFIVEPKIFRDQRGEFVKTFHETAFAELGIDFTLREEFFSTSAKNVVRGLHFQKPPADHAKLVYCASGSIWDVILDLRKNSPTFGKHAAVELSAENRMLFYIPKGFAHGFLSLSDNSLMIYKTDSVHSPEHDAGILWNSADIPWPCSDPIISQRDAAFVKFNDFETPFA